jgi:hypothetical protein
MKFPVVVVVLLLGCDGALAPPAAAPTTRRLLAEPSVTLVGHGRTTCSSGVPKPGIDGQVWCAFAREAGDTTELWVLDISAAVAGAVACDGHDARCLRLTASLWTGDPLAGPSHPTIHGFDGDTLIFYADARAGTADGTYRGPIQAWRPGWSGSRTLTSPDGFICHGHPWAAAAYCVDGVVSIDQDRNYEFDLRAGALAGPGAGPLASAGRIRALGARGELMWGAAFSPDGQLFLHSAPSESGDVEVLSLSPTGTGGLGPATELMRGAARWQLAPDGRKLYYLGSYQYDAVDPTGTLTMVDFPPTAAPAVVLHEHVGRYSSLGDFGQPDRGLAFLHDLSMGNGTLALLRDRGQPATASTVGADVADYVTSPDLRYAFLSQPDSPLGGLVASSDGKTSCPINAHEDGGLVYSVGFSPDGASVFWAQDAPNMVDSEGWYAASDRCAPKRQFSSDLAYLLPVRGGLVYAEKDPGGLTMTLAFAPLEGGVLGAASVIQANVGVSIARGGPTYIVYTSSGEAPGLYAWGPLP